jgi:glucuronoarabinoxylan endo-1,4-beta-xylanase
VLTKRYWAYAQFSRWVRPGMRPHDVTGDTGGAKVLVFTGRGHTVVLAVAPRRRPARFSLQLPWIGSATAAVSQTSRDRKDARQPSVAVNAGVLAAGLPKGSVTTYVLPG